MGRMKKLLLLAFVLFLMLSPVVVTTVEAQSQGESEEEAILVGRISYVEGELLRYVPEEDDWVATVKDAPFGLEDALYSDQDGRAEFIMPNNTSARINGDTQIQMIALKPDLTEVDVASGMARFYNKSSEGVIKATTPFGYVMAPPGSICDLYVGEESVEVVALKGSVDYVNGNDEERYEVQEGSSSIVADNQQVTSGEGTPDPDWDRWNRDRDDFWNKRMEVKGESVDYLPPELQDDAYDLDENGRWERVYYDGSYRRFWRPVRVEPDWEPFSRGRWTDWYGDNTWIPDDEPFGYVTHHYGNWVHAGGFWYWAPPVRRARIYAGPPLLDIGFGWYPGRVGWIHSGVNIGWVPLAPFEPYYAYRRWGRRAIVVDSINLVNFNPKRYRYFNRAIIIDRGNLYRFNNYRNVRLRNFNRAALIRDFRPAPVLSNRVLKNYNNLRGRHNFRNIDVRRKPHRTVLDRIQRNRQIASRNANLRGDALRRNVSNLRQGKLARDARVAPPRVRNKLVPAGQVNRPERELRFRERDLRTSPKVRQEDRGRRTPREDRGRRVGPRSRDREELQQEDRRGRGSRDDRGRRLAPRFKDREELQQEDQGRRGTREDRGRRVGPRSRDREELQQEDQGRRGTREDRGRRVGPRSRDREELQQEDQGRRGTREDRGRRVGPRSRDREELQQEDQGKSGVSGRESRSRRLGREDRQVQRTQQNPRTMQREERRQSRRQQQIQQPQGGQQAQQASQGRRERQKTRRQQLEEQQRQAAQ